MHIILIGEPSINAMLYTQDKQSKQLLWVAVMLRKERVRFVAGIPSWPNKQNEHIWPNHS